MCISKILKCKTHLYLKIINAKKIRGIILFIKVYKENDLLIKLF